MTPNAVSMKLNFYDRTVICLLWSEAQHMITSISWRYILCIWALAAAAAAIVSCGYRPKNLKTQVMSVVADTGSNTSGSYN